MSGNADDKICAHMQPALKLFQITRQLTTVANHPHNSFFSFIFPFSDSGRVSFFLSALKNVLHSYIKSTTPSLTTASTLCTELILWLLVIMNN